MLDPISRHISMTSQVVRIFYLALFPLRKKAVSNCQKIGIILKNKYQISITGRYHNSKKPVSYIKMIGDAHFTHFVPEKGRNRKF